MGLLKNVLILEDEEISAQRLLRMLAEIRPEYQITATFNSIRKSVDWLKNNPSPDLVFVDVHLADGVSFEIFNLVDVRCPAIFTTAYDEYAIKAFKYNSIDYLLKPLAVDELEYAINKFELSQQGSFDTAPLVRNILQIIGKREYREKFLLPYRDSYKRINVEDIAFFYSQEGTCIAKLYTNEKEVVSKTLDSLEQELDPKHFFRANRQYLVHINAIENVHNYFNGKIKLSVKHCREEVIVSRTKASVLKNWLDY